MDYADFLKEWNNADDYIVARTSGSTGAPKDIRLYKADMLRSAKSTVRRFGLDARSVIASLLPMDSIATRMAVVRSICASCRYLNLPPSNDFSLPEHIDLLSIGPSQADCLIRHPEMAMMTGAVMAGGAPLSRERRDALIACGYDIWESYGMTETCSNVALRHGADPLFTANPGITFSTDGRGCLIVHARDYSFDGLQTNDVVSLQSPVSFLWLGRSDNVINSGGVKIFPEQLEAELSASLHIPFYIVAVADAKWGSAAGLVVEGGMAEAMLAYDAIRSVSDRRRRPHYIGAMPEFQRTENGKIRRVLPENFIFSNV